MQKNSDIISLMKNIEDPRQKKKVKYPINEVVGIVLFASLGNANEWTGIEVFCNSHEEFLRKFFKLENGIPSHDTFQRVMGIIDTNAIQQLQLEWDKYLTANDGEGLKKILSIDGKTMRGSKAEDKKPLHVVLAYCDEDGFCLGQKCS